MYLIEYDDLINNLYKTKEEYDLLNEVFMIYDEEKYQFNDFTLISWYINTSCLGF